MMLAMGPRTDSDVLFEIKNGEGEDQFVLRVPSEGTLEMAGWPGWANEQLNELAGITQPALRMLAAEFRGFVGEEHRTDNDESDDVRKLTAALHRRGVAGRQKLIDEACRADERLTAIEDRLTVLIGEVASLAGELLADKDDATQQT